ncbi:MAG: hypothetical protein HY308_00685 [Gammaproteobacteria bacterium]|nr:hypothetical protein [Gammaproteobacteria bacterium]
MNVARDNRIAIVGMSGRFPQASNLDEFWQNLMSQRDCVTAVPADRWEHQRIYSADAQAPLKAYCDQGGFMTAPFAFDNELFGISEREAEVIDPKQRILLEEAFLALQDAGYTRARISGSRTGVYVAGGWDYYAHGLPSAQRITPFGLLGNNNTVLANRISHLFNLVGPSVYTNTFCSSSLVALNMAVRDLRSGVCDTALVGAVQMLWPEHYIALSQFRALSKTGRCRSFDADADGFVPGEGAGVLVLQRVVDARNDHRRIYAQILGTSVNHTGKAANLSSPSSEAQEAVIRQALKDAELPARAIDYIEAHGTGTALGDPIEAKALKNVFVGDDRQGRSCVLGSVKSAIGHLEPAAGIAGLIKIALALQHETIPANLHFRRLNRFINLTNTDLRVCDRNIPWPRQAVPRYAAISSFGMSGTNAHAIVTEADATPATVADPERPLALVISTRTPAQLQVLAGKWAARLDAGADAADLMRTAWQAREPMGYRLGVVAVNATAARTAFTRFAEAAAVESHLPEMYYAGESAPTRVVELAFDVAVDALPASCRPWRRTYDALSAGRSATTEMTAVALLAALADAGIYGDRYECSVECLPLLLSGLALITPEQISCTRPNAMPKAATLNGILLSDLEGVPLRDAIARLSINAVDRRVRIGIGATPVESIPVVTLADPQQAVATLCVLFYLRGGSVDVAPLLGFADARIVAAPLAPLLGKLFRHEHVTITQDSVQSIAAPTPVPTDPGDLLTLVRQRVKAVAQLDDEKFTDETTFDDAGIDSVTRTEIAHDLLARLPALTVTLDQLEDSASIAAIARLLTEGGATIAPIVAAVDWASVVIDIVRRVTNREITTDDFHTPIDELDIDSIDRTEIAAEWVGRYATKQAPLDALVNARTFAELIEHGRTDRTVVAVSAVTAPTIAHGARLVGAGKRLPTGEWRAPLFVDQTHPFFFDHPLDHVSGIQAAESIFALLQQIPSTTAQTWLPTSVHIDFKELIRLDAPNEVFARELRFGGESPARRFFYSGVIVGDRVRCTADIMLQPADDVIGDLPAIDDVVPAAKHTVNKSDARNVFIAPLDSDRFALVPLTEQPHFAKLAPTDHLPLGYLVEAFRQGVRYRAHQRNGAALAGERALITSLSASIDRPITRGIFCELAFSPVRLDEHARGQALVEQAALTTAGITIGRFSIETVRLINKQLVPHENT